MRGERPVSAGLGDIHDVVSSYAERRELTRLEQLVEQLDLMHRQRVGQLEAEEIRLAARHSETRRDLHALEVATNSLRLSFQHRFDGLESQNEEILVGIRHLVLRLP